MSTWTWAGEALASAPAATALHITRHNAASSGGRNTRRRDGRQPQQSRCPATAAQFRYSWTRRVSWRVAAAASPRADVDAPSSTATALPAAVLGSAVKTQLLRCELQPCGGGQAADEGQPDVLWLEVVRSRGGRVEVVCNGELLQLSAEADGSIAVAPAGFTPRLGDAWVKAVPGLADSLKRIRQQQAASGTLPSQLVAARGVAALRPRATLSQFCAAVAAAPGPWCDGTGPGDAPLGEEEQALLTAGELAAFLAGARGVCLLQLHKGWGDAGAARQPLLRPWVLPLLQQAAGHKGAALLASAAPGAPQLGASLVLCARQQPFLAWGKHLAALGVQSSIVADSPFYKLLIGRMLGYKEQNVRHHIESTGGRVTSEVAQAVDSELAGLSSVQPALPWSGSGSRKR